MNDRQLERVSLATGLVASFAVGVPVLLDQVLGSGVLVGDHPVWWWAAYLVHLGVMGAFDAEPAWAKDGRLLLAVQVVAGLVVFALSPEFGFSSVLLVISAASAAYVLSQRGAAAVTAFQTVVVFVVLAFAQTAWTMVVLPTLVFGSFQAFAMLVVVGQLREVAARERLAEVNAQLQAATALLAATSRNEERLRIARELHDLVGHQLTALTLNLEVASHRRGDEQQASVERASEMAKDLLGDVRDAVGELRHPLPSLRSAIDAVVAQVPRPHVHVEMGDDVAVDGDRATAVVRCVQEIVTNVVRHSGADNLWLRVEQDDTGLLEVTARDDGRGAAPVVAGNGLTGMRERLAQLGGELEYASAPEGGFRLAARLPAAVAP